MGVAVAVDWVLLDVGKSSIIGGLVSSVLLLLAIALAAVEVSKHRVPSSGSASKGGVSHRPQPTACGSVPVAIVVVLLFMSAVATTACMPGTGMRKEHVAIRVFS